MIDLITNLSCAFGAFNYNFRQFSSNLVTFFKLPIGEIQVWTQGSKFYERDKIELKQAQPALNSQPGSITFSAQFPGMSTTIR